MQYPELPTVQARLTYRLISFLLDDLAAGYTVEWMDAFHTQRHAAEALGIVQTASCRGWAPASTHAATKSFGKRLSRKIVCGDCGRPFGHKTWHSGTPNRVDVWECPTNYVERGTYTTSHLYQEVLLVKMAEALQVLAGRNSTAVDQAVDSLQSNGCAATPIDAPHGDRQAPDRIADPACAPHPGLPCGAGGRLHAHRWQARIRVHYRRDRHPRPPATLEPRDAPKRTRSYRALLTGLAKSFRSSHESARAVSCS